MRSTYSGPWREIRIKATNKQLPTEFNLKPGYDGLLPLNPAKLNDVIKLSKFIKTENQEFYKNLKNIGTKDDDDSQDEDDNSSGEEE